MVGGVAVVFSKRGLETLLVERGWGSTLRGGRTPPEPSPPGAETVHLVPGTITELVCGNGGRGCTSLALGLSTRFPGKVAWLDPADRFDPHAATRVGLDLSHLLWVRGGEAVLAVRAAQLVVQAGGFRLIVLDLLDHEQREVRFPPAAWFRLLRALERERRTAMLLLARESLAGTCADLVLAARYVTPRWGGAERPLLEGANIEARVQTARRPAPRRPPAGVGALMTEFRA